MRSAILFEFMCAGGVAFGYAFGPLDGIGAHSVLKMTTCIDLKLTEWKAE